MPYTIGFGMRGKRSKVSTIEKPTAKDALKSVRDLRASDEEIKFIKGPYGGEIGLEELEINAEEEGQK